jgi:16S rRNA (cytidine1402-2'-O)-methyltransferase
MLSYHAHNEPARARELIEKLERGADVALVSDAGTPLVSDPGYRLVTDAIASGISVVPIPGACAAISALSASGLPSDTFTFAGFLPRRKAARRARLAELSLTGSTLVFYEAPHRIRQTLADIREVLGDRPCVIARELTKIHEGFLRKPLTEIDIEKVDERGEIVIIVGPAEEKQPATRGEESNSILEEVERLMKSELLDQKAALKRVARARHISKSEAYRKLLDERSLGKQE